MEQLHIVDRFIGGQVTASEIAHNDVGTLLHQIGELRECNDPDAKDVLIVVFDEVWNDELWGKETGYRDTITILPEGKTLAGNEYNASVVEIVVLDNDGTTIAYRLSTDAQDDDWEIGEIMDAVVEAVAAYDSIVSL